MKARTCVNTLAAGKAGRQKPIDAQDAVVKALPTVAAVDAQLIMLAQQ
jgi:hypothetical protein